MARKRQAEGARKWREENVPGWRGEMVHRIFGDSYPHIGAGTVLGMFFIEDEYQERVAALARADADFAAELAGTIGAVDGPLANELLQLSAYQHERARASTLDRVAFARFFQVNRMNLVRHLSRSRPSGITVGALVRLAGDFTDPDECAMARTVVETAYGDPLDRAGAILEFWWRERVAGRPAAPDVDWTEEDVLPTALMDELSQLSVEELNDTRMDVSVRGFGEACLWREAVRQGLLDGDFAVRSAATACERSYRVEESFADTLEGLAAFLGDRSVHSEE